MSMQRAIKRSMAKARLRAMQVQRVNKHLGMGMCNSMNRRLHRTERNKLIFADLQKRHKPIWRRVLNGDLAEAGRNALYGIGKKRKFMVVWKA